jgi:hypothetical protein
LGILPISQQNAVAAVKLLALFSAYLANKKPILYWELSQDMDRLSKAHAFPPQTKPVIKAVTLQGNSYYDYITN